MTTVVMRLSNMAKQIIAHSEAIEQRVEQRNYSSLPFCFFYHTVPLVLIEISKAADVRKKILMKYNSSERELQYACNELFKDDK